MYAILTLSVDRRQSVNLRHLFTFSLFFAKIKEISSFSNPNKSLKLILNMKKISILLIGIVFSEIVMISMFFLTDATAKGILALLSTKEQIVNASIPFAVRLTYPYSI